MSAPPLCRAPLALIVPINKLLAAGGAAHRPCPFCGGSGLPHSALTPRCRTWQACHAPQMSRRESAADQERARKREREEQAEGGGSPEGKKPKAEGGGAEEEARVAELRKKRLARKAMQEEQAQKEQARPPAQQPSPALPSGLASPPPSGWQEAKKEAGAAVAGEGEGASAQSSSQQSQSEYATETTTYLCTMLGACGNGDLHDLIEEHVTMPEDIAAR